MTTPTTAAYDEADLRARATMDHREALAIALQEMSDAAKSLTAAYSVNTVVGSHLAPFILPDPVLTLEQQMDDEATKICAQFGFTLTHTRKAVETALRRGRELAKVQP